MRIFNVILIFNYYCRNRSDNPFICYCDMVPRQTYLSDMTLLYTGATCHTKNDQSLHSLKEFEYCIEEMQAFRYMTWPPTLGTYWAALWVFALATLASTQYKQNRLLTCRNRDTLQTCYWLWCTARLHAIWPLPTRVLVPYDTWGRVEQFCGFEPWQLSPVPSINKTYCIISM
jgi:hypothetical protein